jgi:O-antigen/teichoic acid export membrane protein
MSADDDSTRGRQADARPDRPAGHAGPQRVLYNGALNFLSQAASSLLNAGVVIVLARRLGADGFGEFCTFFAVTMIVQMLTDAGVGTVLTARVVRARDGWRPVASEGLGLVLVVGLLTAAGLLAAGAAWAGLCGDGSCLLRFAIVAAACAGVQAQQYALGVLRAFERFGYESLARFLQGLVFLGAAALFVGSGPNALEAALAALAASHVLAAALLLGRLQRGWRCLGVRVHLGAFRSWLTEAVPLALGDLVRRLTNQVDIVLLLLLEGSMAAVGIYRLACLPLGSLTLLPRMLLLVTFPSFVRLSEGGRQAMAGPFARSTRLLVVFSLPIAVTLCAFAQPITLVLGGPEFLDAAAPMAILVWIVPLNFVSAQFRFLFTALGRQRLYVALALLTFGVETALEAALIPGGSYLGLCVGFLLGEAVFVAAGLAACHRLGLRGVAWGRLGGAALGAALMGAGLWLVRGWPLPLLGAAALVALAGYFGWCLLTGAVVREEAAQLLRAARAVGRRLGARGGQPAPPSTASGLPEARPPAGRGLPSELVATPPE